MVKRKLYPLYKDSEIEWIGEAPENWRKVSLKRCFKVKNGREILDKEDGIHKEIAVYGSGGVFKKTSNYLHDGDSVLFGRKGTIGKPLFVTNKFWTVDTMYYTEFPKNMSPKYFYYLLFIYPWDLITTKTALPSVVGLDVENTLVSIPEFKEQLDIVAFLDHKTSEIDSLITDKEKLITLLEEKRQAVITEAVTKGLNSDVEMKESGVEWIGEIPEHWKLGKLKNLSSRIGDGLHGTPTYDDTGQYYFINGNNLGDRSLIIKEGTNRINKEEYSKYKSNLTDRTIFISLNGTVGNLSIYNGEAVMLSKSVGYINLANIDLEFVYYYLESSHVKTYFDLSFAGTTINNLSLETLRNTLIFIPQLDEQKEIVDHLITETMKIDTLIKAEKDTITLLKEYRQSLIYEAVTGKIDVREYGEINE